MENKNILILSAGRRVELVKWFKKTARQMGIDNKIVAVDISNSAPALYFADERYIIPKISSNNFIHSIIDIANKENIALIIPTIDTELAKLAKNREYIEKNTKAKVMISDSECIEICGDKFKTAKFLSENGFAIPKTFTKQEIDKGEFCYPLFIKPMDGSSSVNAFKVDDKKQLDFLMQYVKNPIVQECVSGTEYTVDVFTDFEGNVITIVPRIRIATRGGEVLKGQVDKNQLIIKDIQKLINCLKPIGHITIQGFLGQDNIFRYIEINARFGGGAPMSFMAGANSCQCLYKLLDGDKLQYNENYRDAAVFSRFDDCVEIEI